MYLQLFLSKTILKIGKGYIWEVITPKNINLKRRQYIRLTMSYISLGHGASLAQQAARWSHATLDENVSVSVTAYKPYNST